MTTVKPTAKTKAAHAFNVSEEVSNLFKSAINADDLAHRAADAKVSVGTSMLQLAQQAETVEQFLEEAERCEKMHKASRRKDKNIPRAWTQAKSNIKAAIRAGLDVNAYGTEGTLRKALNEWRKGIKQAKAAEAKAAEPAPDALSTMLAQIDASFTDSDERAALATKLEEAVTAMILSKATKPEGKAVKAA